MELYIYNAHFLAFATSFFGKYILYTEVISTHGDRRRINIYKPLTHSLTLSYCYSCCCIPGGPMHLSIYLGIAPSIVVSAELTRICTRLRHKKKERDKIKRQLLQQQQQFFSAHFLIFQVICRTKLHKFDLLFSQLFQDDDDDLANFRMLKQQLSETSVVEKDRF